MCQGKKEVVVKGRRRELKATERGAPDVEKSRCRSGGSMIGHARRQSRYERGWREEKDKDANAEVNPASIHQIV